jgi:predicted lipoprotein with Yx(FWY)xxD motif
MRGLALVLVSAAIGGWLAGCGASTPPSHTSAVTTAENRPAAPVKPAPPRPSLVRVSRTAYGTALTDRRGFALYRFTHDTGAASTCYDACASAWPPYLVPRERARSSADGGSVGTTRRTDGRLQVTYAGHPLYYYVGDRRPGQVLCQGVAEFGGGWYVVAPSGHLIR